MNYNVPIHINRHIQHDGPATNLAVLNVILFRQRIIDQYRYRLAAIRAADLFFRNLRHYLNIFQIPTVNNGSTRIIINAQAIAL